MTYVEIYTEVVNLRFSTQTVKLAQVKKWVNQAEIAVWDAAPWVFKRVAAANLTIGAGNNKPTSPADFGKARHLYDYLGAPLTYHEPDDFEDLFEADLINGVTGEPSDYTVINRQIHLAPIPQTGRTYKLSYRRRYAHLNGALATVAGVMGTDTDQPIWDSEFHYILVPWAMILGQKLEGDPTAEDLRNQRDEMLAAMKEDLVGGVEGELVQWGGP